MQEITEHQLGSEQHMMRDASLFLHRDATVDISKFKTLKTMFPHMAGKYAAP
jgi:hypothetical protein